MSRIGYGYGSEWHLLRYLGYHREQLDKEVVNITKAQSIQWLDFPFAPNTEFYDADWKQLDFLPTDHPARKAWTDYWPQTGNTQNWDSIGILSTGDTKEWLLVEAKAHTGELESSCGASEKGGLSLIRRSLDETKKTMAIPAESDWLRPYYQYANRLAVLHFLTKHNIPARLLFIYFTGDKVPNKICPLNEEEWKSALQKMYTHLRLSGHSEMEEKVHSLFLPVYSV